MGRRVYERGTGEFIWKYAFAEQDSEQYRIPQEIGVGKHLPRKYDDVVVIQKKEIPLLEQYLTEKNADEKIREFELFLEDNVYTYDYDEEGNVSYVGIPAGKIDAINNWKKENCPDIRFYQMIEAYIDYMKSHDQETFYFEGEY